MIVGVSLDTVDSHVQFCTKKNLTFKLLSDPDHAVTSQYGSLSSFGKMQVAARNTFLIDPKGIIKKVYLKVDPNPHSSPNWTNCKRRATNCAFRACRRTTALP